MDDENDDVVAVEVSSEIANMENDKPLMSLFNRLIGNNKKQQKGTVLTNAQIIFILEKEFDISVNSLHNLNVMIYMNIIKKFLKHWPLWDEFDSKIKLLRKNNNEEGIKKLIETKHRGLKMYLKRILDISEPLVKQSTKDIIDKEKTTITKDSNDVIMEVSCTRPQLHNLIYNRPNPNTGALFNIESDEQSRIKLTHLPSFHKSILNWWCFSINIMFNSFIIRRETCHELKHVLVNKKLNVPEESVPLNKCFQEKSTVTKQNLGKNDLFQVLQKIKDHFNDTEFTLVITFLLNIILEDLNNAPNALKVPAMYRRHMSTYTYIRYLCSEANVESNSEDANKYDLQLQETISPMFQLWLGKIEQIGSLVTMQNEIYDRVYIECKDCKLKFYGKDMLQSTEQHFLEVHNINEPGWMCTQCRKRFPMFYLAQQKWRHSC